MNANRVNDDVIIWKRFPQYWPFQRGTSSRVGGDLRRRDPHVTSM